MAVSLVEVVALRQLRPRAAGDLWGAGERRFFEAVVAPLDAALLVAVQESGRLAGLPEIIREARASLVL